MAGFRSIQTVRPNRLPTNLGATDSEKYFFLVSEAKTMTSALSKVEILTVLSYCNYKDFFAWVRIVKQITTNWKISLYPVS